MLFDYAVDVASADVLRLMCKFPSSSYTNIKEEREREREKNRRKNNSNSRYTNLQ
jgi:hypothetical protein